MAKDNKEEKILNAAIQIFYTKGFGSATTSEIAREAGVAEGTIFRYFKTKKDILVKVFDSFVDIFAEEIAIKPLEDIFENNKGLSLDTLLRIIIKDRINLMEKHFEMLLIVLGEVRYHPEIQTALYEKIVKRVVPMIEKYIIDCIDKGIIKDMEPAVITRSLIGSIVSYVLQRRVLPIFNHENMELDKEIDMFIHILLYGIIKTSKEE